MATSRFPTVLYAQDKKHLFLTIDLQDIQDHQLDLKEDSIYFDTTLSSGIHYQFKIDFFGKVVNDTWHSNITNRHIELVVEKQDTEKYWPRLQKQSGKLQFVKTDFAKWRDEDEEDDVEPQQPQDMMNQELMMKMMQGGGMGAMPGMDAMSGMGEEQADSDDEEVEEVDIKFQ
jgi:prostaglandin-E synthase